MRSGFSIVTNPPMGFVSRVDRSTCAGVGSRVAGDSTLRTVMCPGIDGKSIEREELNHERPDNKGLPVSGKRVDAENATSWSSIELLVAVTICVMADKRAASTFWPQKSPGSEFTFGRKLWRPDGRTYITWTLG